MTATRTTGQNFFATVLEGTLDSTGLLLDVETSGAMGGEVYLVVDPRNPQGREVLRAEVTSATRFTVADLADRYLQGSAAGSNLTHQPGTEVWSVPVSQNIDDLWDAVELLDSELDGAVSSLESSIEAMQPLVAAIATGNIPLPWTDSIGAIPAGFQLADGTNGTPDLRNLFLLGSGSRSVGATGGYEDAVVVEHNHSNGTLSAASHSHSNGSLSAASHNHGNGSLSAASHNHGVPARESGTGGSGGHTHTVSGRLALGSGATPMSNTTVNTGNSGSLNVSGSTSNSGALNVSGTTSASGSLNVSGSTSNQGVSGVGRNMPPYYVVAWIVWVGA